ncbi:hypothetical protein HZU77_013435 [Neisseriaceae bacterium TC5R-5]|nr:hypothetical protein [Neisseriaceae bacterium TC5R-5]
MRLADLISNRDSGRMSHTKLWANVACASATGMFIHHGIENMLTPETWLIYLGLVGGYAAGVRWIDAWRHEKEAQHKEAQHKEAQHAE